MKWIKKKKKNPNSKEEDIEIQVEENEPNSKKPSSSSSNFSKILPFSSWLSKLKQFPKPNAAAAFTKRSTAPLPKPLFSPPPLPHPPADAIPRRLSVGDDETHLARTRAAQSLPRISRHNSIGSELELRSDLHLLDPIRTNRRRRQRAAAPNPMRGGQRPSGGRIRPKVRVFSPRLANPNPVGLERYAVVKRSKDPARDFRESMAEMIWERGIGRSDELESLLACYLSLNSDEHHDVIIKVFRQVCTTVLIQTAYFQGSHRVITGKQKSARHALSFMIVEAS